MGRADAPRRHAGTGSYGFPIESDHPGDASSVAATVRVGAEDALRFVEQLLAAHDIPPEHAAVIADGMVTADLRGVGTHGIVRLPGYLDRLRRGLISNRPRLAVEQVSAVCARVDGDNGFGFVVANRAVDLAIDMARASGVGVASAFRSTHFGMAANYALRVVRAGLIGIVMTNASRAMPPFGGREALLGTGPVAIGAPGGRRSSDFLLDMSPAVAARGKIRLAAQHGEKIPEGFALDAQGRSTTDPIEALKGVVLPLGGPKGSGLALAMDILAGVVSGAAFGGDVGDQYKDYDRPQNVGHLVIALRADLFVTRDEYEARMDTLIDRVHDNPRMEGVESILIPGEPESQREVLYRREGIPVGRSELEALQREASAAGVRGLTILAPRHKARPPRPTAEGAHHRALRIGQAAGKGN